MTEQTRNEIVRRWQTGLSRRTIAQQLGLSRRTVARAIAQIVQQRSPRAEHPGAEHRNLPRPTRRRPSSLDAHEPFLKELLERYPNITAQRVHEELRARGFAGKYTIVRDRVRRLRPRPKRQLVQRFETGPGAQAQMDYATYDIDFTETGKRRVHLFSYVLGYSRRQYVRFVESQDMETTLREHVRAFEHLGGAAAVCLYDNMKVVVTQHDEGGPVYNTRFLAFATHYGFRPWACRPRRAQTKGKVERPFQFVESSLLNGRSFRSLEHLNKVAAWWLEHVADVRVHRETKCRPLDRHAEERVHLVPLPERPYDTAEVVYRTVNAEGCVAYRQNFYSVPWQHISRALPVRITEQELIVYGEDLQEVARHVLLPRSRIGDKSQQREHRPSEEGPARLAMLQQRFAQMGPVASRFLEGLLREQRYGKDQACKLLALLAGYRRPDALAALERATRFGAFSWRAVERILAVQARPKSGLEDLAEQARTHLGPVLEGPPVSPRPAAEYQQTFFEEPPDDGRDIPPAPPEEECPFDAP
jgi:transposase